LIRAEVISCDDFVAHGGEAGAKAAGKLRVESPDYVVGDGEVLHFRLRGGK
jgi:ribosome-binding ATPase YchF (GTP1/OBG family)